MKKIFPAFIHGYFLQSSANNHSYPYSGKHFNNYYFNFVLFAVVTYFAFLPTGICADNNILVKQIKDSVIYTPGSSTVKISYFEEAKSNLSKGILKTILKNGVFKINSKMLYIELNTSDGIEKRSIEYSKINKIRILFEDKDIRGHIAYSKDMQIYFCFNYEMNDKEKYSNAKLIVDALYALKNINYEVSFTDDLKNFEVAAEQYRNMSPKPEISEEVRKYVVQATSMANDKKYDEAIIKYNKAIEIDPVYPDAHFNLALLCAQSEDYERAIFEMKKYLLLVPDAKDARAAKDKIYEWEAKME